MLPEFDQEMAQTRKLLACLPEGKNDYRLHAKSVTLGRLAGHVAELPSWAVMRDMVMNHIIHHRAQLGVYLRLNEVAIPGMYGPSADEARSF